MESGATVVQTFISRYNFTSFGSWSLNLMLLVNQNFAVEDWSILLTNASYMFVISFGI